MQEEDTTRFDRPKRPRKRRVIKIISEDSKAKKKLVDKQPHHPYNAGQVPVTGRTGRKPGVRYFV
ncbi:hypothetical protein PTH_1669 [Pelotomaculum thermopropionicum SI]|uniref:Uncharacterized protein n=1 Tax=Pelotomaculum thermopropionicum (strain DSM 13744 / JCM 10971 / SI) TaxID=370438 RepID=A5D1P7_PELTS|nr:hypothetical protein PTH_1669 [Pelotomaculum thermopropionicum SI]